MSVDLLAILVVVPVAGALVHALIPGRAERAHKVVALAITTGLFLLSLVLLDGFRPEPGMQFEVNKDWLPALGIRYHVGVDGLSLWLIILTTFLTPVSLLGSWNIHHRVKAFQIFMLLLEAGMLGVFVALDLFLFYIFWEAMLIPMYFLIGVWGHERRIYAAVKFFLYTMAGSALMLVAFIALYFTSPSRTFDILVLTHMGPVDPGLQMWLFAAFALAFAIKVPMFPFHTWLPDAHVEAPTAGSVILAGVMLKMGGYGFLRLAFPLFPDAAQRFAPWIGALAVVGIIYGALVSLVQPNLKKLVAYSSVSHLGFVMLGIAAFTTTSVVGAVYQMLNHGISTGALFLCVGMLYDRRHTFAISEYGGLKAVMPWFASLFLIVCLSSLAVPGFNGFIGEFLILMGSWALSRPMVALASLGVILAAGYILWMVQRVLYGEVTHEVNRTLPDLSPREFAVLIPLVVLAIAMGVCSPLFTRLIEPTAQTLIQETRGRARTAPATTASRAAVPAAEGAGR
jgi:NADH-quinone oxidoreductase subunit M